LDTDENAKLIFVLFYETILEQDAYKELTSEIGSLRRKYGSRDQKSTSTRSIEYMFIRSTVPSNFILMDLVLQTIGRDNLYLIVTPWTEVYGDFLNRVRMNTIKEFQVFFPVPFVQFNPKIVNRQKGGGVGVVPDRIDVHKTVGRFDKYDFNVASFYGSDYQSRWGNYAAENSERLYFDLDLLSLFLNSSVHIFRAVEPSLKIRCHQKSCDHRSRSDLYERCSTSKKEALGTKSQLASLLLEFGAIDDLL